MAAIDDLTAAITRLNTSISSELTAIADKLAGQVTGGVSPAQVEAAVTQINAVADKLDAETATLTAPSPAPVPTPTPTPSPAPPTTAPKA